MKRHFVLLSGLRMGQVQHGWVRVRVTFYQK